MTTEHKQADEAAGTGETPLFLTAKEVAALLRLSVGLVYQLADAGLLPHIRFGRRIRFSARGIHALDDEALKECLRRLRGTNG